MRNAAFDPEFLIDETLALNDPILKQAFEYWKAKRGDRLAPTRADINPREAKALLPHMQLIDVLDGGRAVRTRLIGTTVARALKVDPTGQLFDDTSAHHAVRRMLLAVRWVVGHRKPLRTFAERTAIEDMSFLSHETVLLPLSNDGTVIDMIAVVSAFKPA
jgi:hypothetical protein